MTQDAGAGQTDEPTVSEAVRRAREDDFTNGVGWASLEGAQAWDTPLLKGGQRAELFGRLLRGLCLVAPFGGLLLPLGNPGGPGESIMESDGFSGDGLKGMALVVFWLAAIGQVWTLREWARWGRHRSGLWTACSVLAVICSALALWWFHSLLHPHSYAQVALPIGATLVLGAIALVVMLRWSRPGDPDEARVVAQAEAFRRLPAADQQALQDERQEILAVLLERKAVTEEQAAEAAALPLGDWYLLDREPDERPA